MNGRVVVGGDIPEGVRREVLTRHGGPGRVGCAMCGKTLRAPALHHVVFGGSARGMGGRRVHDPAEIVPLGNGLYDCPCHQWAHADKGLWEPFLLQVAARPYLTAFQLRRWAAAGRTPAPDLGLVWTPPPDAPF